MHGITHSSATEDSAIATTELHRNRCQTDRGVLEASGEVTQKMNSTSERVSTPCTEAFVPAPLRIVEVPGGPLAG